MSALDPPKGVRRTNQWCAYSARRYRMSAYIATIMTAQYAPHCALSVTPNQTRHRNGITGRTIAAAISAEFLQLMPRYRIQKIIGSVMPAAIASKAWVGYWMVTSSHDLTPTTDTKIAPVANIPTTIAPNISRKCRQKGESHLS